MKQTLDPCEDFYQYVCGDWFDTNNIPATHSSWSIDSVIIRERDQKLRGILESPIENYHRDSAEKKIKLMYQTCLDVDTIDNEGIQPLMGAINSYGGWAVKGNAFTYNLPCHTMCNFWARKPPFYLLEPADDCSRWSIHSERLRKRKRTFFWRYPWTLLITLQKMARL